MEVVASQWQDVVTDPRYKSSSKEVQVNIPIVIIDDNCVNFKGNLL